MHRLEDLFLRIGRSALRPRYRVPTYVPGTSRAFHHTEGTVLLPVYSFYSAAYGIPKKRHQLPPVSSSSQNDSGVFGRLASFFGSKSPPPEENDELPAAIAALHGSGLRSSIRDEGRIVLTRLLSQQVGEDAYFLMDDALGVADGVGGWASRPHANPALFSRLLMHFCRAELDVLHARWCNSDGYDEEWQGCDPVDIMQTAWERCVRASKREGIMGSATALLALLRGDELRIANIGDCVLIIIRDGEMVFRSIEQQHSFNFPVQLGMMDATEESVRLSAAVCQHRDGVLRDGGLDEELPYLGPDIGCLVGPGEVEDGRHWDSPKEDAGTWVLHVQEGDVVIMSSDGMLDNLFDEDIVEEVRRVCREMANSEDRCSVAHAISEALCCRAKAASEDPRLVVSPFQQQAVEEGMYYVGGKVDDITVVTGIVARADVASFESSHDNINDDDNEHAEPITVAHAR
ncbi:protein-serine/threonine phosphatase [Malassezia cuniculi]|uniref:Protein phosphatase n=1 Tax=Malassezia cuniculi TaxID=948313 RepID=A0AAF0ET54_9BASI|nr:protein-serine/threonine phosphatase [Malassezia cuniculi]